jgi:ATP-dependent protease ClpP protease subunit
MSSGHLWVYGVIGDKPKGATEKYYSLQDFRTELDPKASDYVVHIMSPGGDVYQGLAMFNALRSTGKKIRVQIEGLCASIATLIAGAASPGELVIQENSHYMIHQPSFPSYGGTADQLRTGAEQLDQIRSLLVSTYQKRTKLPEEQLWAMSSKDNWMLPDQAKELGFVDEVVEAMKAVAFAGTNSFINMEPNKLSAIEATLKKIEAFLFGKPKAEAPKNVSDTLADGTVIQIDSEDGDWAGKSVVREDGSPLETGTYELSGGRTLIVGDNSTVQEVQEAATDEVKLEEKPDNDDMKFKEENETLKARIAELESALEARNEVAEKAEDRAKNAENIARDVKAELQKIKTTTAGDAILNRR